jgi:hypothetical protein
MAMRCRIRRARRQHKEDFLIEKIENNIFDGCNAIMTTQLSPNEVGAQLGAPRPICP